MSLWIPRSTPERKRLRSNSDYRSNRRGFAIHRPRVNRRKRRRHAINCNAHAAKKCEPGNFRTTSPDTMRSPVALRTKKKQNFSVIASSKERIYSQSRWVFPPILPSPDKRRVRRHLQLDRSSLWCARFRWEESCRAASHWWPNFCRSMCVRKMQLSCDHAPKLLWCCWFWRQSLGMSPSLLCQRCRLVPGSRRVLEKPKVMICLLFSSSSLTHLQWNLSFPQHNR